MPEIDGDERGGEIKSESVWMGKVELRYETRMHRRNVKVVFLLNNTRGGVDLAVRH